MSSRRAFRLSSGSLSNCVTSCAGSPFQGIGCSSNPTADGGLCWRERQVEHGIRLGRDVAEKILDRRRRILSFAPDSIVAYVRWASGDFGTIVSRIDILRTVRRGEAFSTVPYVRPGGEILLRVTGWPKVERVLQAVDARWPDRIVPR